jgi:hypothetical protein
LAPPLAYGIESGGASSKDQMMPYSVSGKIDATASGFTAVSAPQLRSGSGGALCCAAPASAGPCPHKTVFDSPESNPRSLMRAQAFGETFDPEKLEKLAR